MERTYSDHESSAVSRRNSNYFHGKILRKYLKLETLNLHSINIINFQHFFSFDRYISLSSTVTFMFEGLPLPYPSIHHNFWRLYPSLFGCYRNIARLGILCFVYYIKISIRLAFGFICVREG